MPKSPLLIISRMILPARLTIITDDDRTRINSELVPGDGRLVIDEIIHQNDDRHPVAKIASKIARFAKSPHSSRRLTVESHCGFVEQEYRWAADHRQSDTQFLSARTTAKDKFTFSSKNFGFSILRDELMALFFQLKHRNEVFHDQFHIDHSFQHAENEQNFAGDVRQANRELQRLVHRFDHFHLYRTEELTGGPVLFLQENYQYCTVKS
uniref:Uncharacterized protein n=1 Tax=Strigamia maritima TaxID=126957 RepID=T1JHW9_STRMM